MIRSYGQPLVLIRHALLCHRRIPLHFLDFRCEGEPHSPWEKCLHNLCPIFPKHVYGYPDNDHENPWPQASEFPLENASGRSVLAVWFESISSHARKSLNPRDKTTAPINKPMNPIEINPPIEPRKITSMGTGAPRPNRIGFKKLSDNMTNISQTINIPAVNVSA